MTTNWFVNMAYFIVAVVFILGLKAMASPVTAKKGIVWAGIAMVGATVVTFFIPGLNNVGLMVLANVLGGGVAWYSGQTVKMTDMPQTVDSYNGMGGGAAAGIAAIELVRGAQHDAVTSTLLALGAIIGSVAFSGSCVAFAKLQAGDLPGARSDFVILANSLDANPSEAVRQRAQAAMQLIDAGSAKALPGAVKAAAALPKTPPMMQLPPAVAPNAAQLAVR